MGTQTFDPEQGLIQLPGSPETWIWAFTCPEAECACRTAVLSSREGDRDALADCGRSVADAWSAGGHYGQAAERLQDATAFSIDLDTLEVYPPVGDNPIDVEAHPAVRAIVEQLNDDLLDAVARVWLLGKSVDIPEAPGAGGKTIAIDGWRPGDLVVWDDAQPALRGDTYVIDDHVFEALELYCVEPDCACGEVIVDFGAVAPRGAAHPGHVEFDGRTVKVCPSHERHRLRLTELWTAYCRRHRKYRDRFSMRSSTMHKLAGRVVAAPPKPKVSRNATCPCGSGKKYKRCCGAAA